MTFTVIPSRKNGGYNIVELGKEHIIFDSAKTRIEADKIARDRNTGVYGQRLIAIRIEELKRDSEAQRDEKRAKIKKIRQATVRN